MNTSAESHTRSNEEVALAVKINLAKVYDPDLGYDLVSLGLIYGVTVADGQSEITMTLTSPACPYGPELMYLCKKAGEAVDEVNEAHINLVWEPSWGPQMMTEDLRLELGFDV